MSGSADDMVRVAREWIGVRFRHQGRTREGVDCLGLLVCVAHACKLKKADRWLADYDQTDYAHYPDVRRLYDGLRRVLTVVQDDAIRRGDIVLLTIDSNPQHLGIVGDYAVDGLSLIHAYAPARKVVEHRLDEAWLMRVNAVFRFES